MSTLDRALVARVARVAAWAGLLFFGGLPPVAAQAAGEAATASSGVVEQASGPLDGMWFGGDFGVEGKPANSRDIVEFKDGQFISRCCIRLGFSPVRYEHKRVGDAIHFTATTESPTHGSMIWEGIVRDGHAEVDVRWRREHFLWTHRNQFWFKGDMGNVVSCRGDAEDALAGQLTTQ